MKRYHTHCPTCEDLVWRLYVDSDGNVCCEKCETVIGPVKSVHYQVKDVSDGK